MKSLRQANSEAITDKNLLLKLFRVMLLIRCVEETLAKLLEEGEIRCPTHLYTGQEAIAAGVCGVLTDRDYIFGGHRSHGHYLAKGGDLRALLAEIFGKVSGCARGRGGSMHIVAPAVGILGTVPIVAATIPIAVGAAMAAKFRKQGQVSVAFFGDGATEEGHFHESLNLAAIQALPVLFVCENNLYSSHMHITERRPLDNIHKFAELYDMPGVTIDGNDVAAVYGATSAGVKRAQEGHGPSLIECRTYRWRGHVGPAMDMDVGVKRSDELQEWLPRDPLIRTKQQLLELGYEESKIAAMGKEVSVQVEEAVQFARESEYPDVSDLHAYVFSTLGVN